MAIDLQTLRRADIVVVGSGCFGATVAERAATQLGRKVCVLEKRPQIGGNCHSELCRDTGIECHTYGTHIFHTSCRNTWEYINKFTKFTDYRHHVMTTHRDAVYSMPINLGTICAFFGRRLTPEQARALIAAQVAAEKFETPRNFEEKAISLIGRPLYEAFIEGYTRKQWQVDPRELPSTIISRLPVRYTFNSRYFSDRFEGLPEHGYSEIFRRMLDHPNIDVHTGVDWFDLGYAPSPAQLLVYTGAIDRYFDYCYGELGWRTIDFQREVHAVPDFQGVSVMNYADADVPFTRIHEFRHLHPERAYGEDNTVIFKEFSRLARRSDEPYYPIDTRADQETYARYRARAEALPNVVMGGRLGRYHYLDMHQAIAAALKISATKLPSFFSSLTL